MLTRSQIKKASRLQHQVGELRPGYLKDQTANFEGPASSQRSSPISLSGAKKRKAGGTKAKSKKVKISVSFDEDPVTGEIRLIQN